MSQITGMGNWGTLAPALYNIENLVFKGQTVSLDGYSFKNCAFVDCVLTTTTGNFVLEECFFGGQWFVSFTAGAAKIIKLGGILDWSKPNPEFTAKIDPNGGVTIK